MGTSSNHPSPNSPNWNLVRAVLGKDSVDEKRQSNEIWRAAIADRGEMLSNDLSSSLLASACNLAAKISSVPDAVAKYEQSLLESHSSGLTLDLGKRALARAVATKTGANGFATELFAEMASYYVARDLPSFVGAQGRVKTTTESIALKNQLQSLARKAATSIPVKTDARGWKGYVNQVLDVLKRGERK
jgi:hypothetical protein